MLNGKANDSPSISMHSAYRVGSVYSSYSVYSVVYSVLLINSANTLNHSVYSVSIVRYSDLFTLFYSVLVFNFNSSYSVISLLVLLGGLIGYISRYPCGHTGRCLLHRMIET